MTRLVWLLSVTICKQPPTHLQITAIGYPVGEIIQHTKNNVIMEHQISASNTLVKSAEHELSNTTHTIQSNRIVSHLHQTERESQFKVKSKSHPVSHFSRSICVLMTDYHNKHE